MLSPKMVMFRAAPTVSVKQLAATLLVVGTLVIGGCSSPEERAQSHYDRGTELLKADDYAHAALEFKNAIQLKNNMVPAWLGLAEVAEHDEDWAELAAILQKITELDPKNVETKLRLARLELLGGNFEQALKITNEAQQLEGRNAEIRALKAMILFKLGEMGNAVTEAEAALEIDPFNSDAIVLLAAYRLVHGDPDGALSILDRDPDKHAKDFAVQLFKLKVYETTQDFDKIETLLKTFIETYPQEPKFKTLLVTFYMQQHREADAEKTIREIAAADPSNSAAELGVVRFLLQAKGVDAAKQELQNRIAAGGDIFPYEMALADLLYSQGQTDESLALLDSVANSKQSDENVVAAKIQLAQQQLGQKDYDAAERTIAEILTKDQRNVSALQTRAALRLAKGQMDDAISDLRAAINEKPDSSDLLALLATAYERSGSIELADETFAKAVKASKSNPELGVAYAGFLQRRGMSDRAEDLLVELTGNSPKNEQVLSALAQVKLLRRDWSGAQQVAESVRVATENENLADKILGEAFAGQKRYDLSIDALKRAYAAAPEEATMAALMRAYLGAKQPDKAEAFLQSVLTTNPTSADAYVLLGTIQLQQGREKEALQNFNAAIANQPDQPAGYVALSGYYSGKQQYADSMKSLQAGVQKQPTNFALRLAAAEVENLQGDYEASIAAYEELLKEQPGSLVIMNNLASLLSDHRTDKASFDRARSLAESLAKVQVPQFKDTLGWVHYRQGDFKSAIPLLEQAQGELPDLALVHYHLGMAYLAVGDLPKATEQLNKALSLLPISGGIAEEEIRAALKKAGVT